MTVDAHDDIFGLMKVGRLVGLTIRAMQEHVQPGITTEELDTIGAAFLKEHGARSAPVITYNYPTATIISIDDEAAHGIPGERVVREDDLVKIDVSAELDGYFADSNVTVPVGEISRRKQLLVDCTKRAFERAIASARAGRPMYEVGRATEDTVRRCGFNVIRELPGHGVGRALHESPSVPNFYWRRASEPLHEGLVITIEPHIAMGKGQIVTDRDGWTLRTRDGSPVASFEHTVIITEDKPVLVTAV